MSAVAVLVLTQSASVCVKERGRALRETVLLKLPTHFGIGLPDGQLCGVYSWAAVFHVEPAASAGSLAVISQPAFLPFVYGSGLSALECLRCLGCLRLCLLFQLPELLKCLPVDLRAYVHDLMDPGLGDAPASCLIGECL